MRNINPFGLSVPMAELLLVAGLFWVAIVANVMTDVLGTVVFRQATAAQGWEIMVRDHAPHYPVGNREENLWIFWPQPEIQNQLEQSTGQSTTWAESPPPSLPGSLTSIPSRAMSAE